jgi:GT2 family glycosyltransferase
VNITSPEKIVVLGFMSHYPVAGVIWQTIHYLIGFRKLGYDVFYVEAHGITPSKLMQDKTDDGAARAAAFIARVLGKFDLGDRWAYHSLYPVIRHFGLNEMQLKQLYGSASAIINLHGSHVPTRELTATERLVYLETDPVNVEVDLHYQRPETVEYLAPHAAFFTFGENLGRPDCLVPSPKQFKFLPTRQPVVLEFWQKAGSGPATSFTTIGNWRQPWREVEFNGDLYRWSKHFEFQKFIDLPPQSSQPFELALSSSTCNAEEKQLLESKGWRVRDALEFSGDLDAYRAFIGESRGEFTVAKDQNVRLRSGWFSDRAATYLAASRPVITQETGFTNTLPTGQGLFAFSTMEEILGAVEVINSDYDKARRAAWNIAQEFFSHEVVLGQLLRDLGFSRRAQASPQAIETTLPSDLVLTPLGRWPTRLPDNTVRAALALPTPIGPRKNCPRRARRSVVVVTFNGLAYTKMCFANLLGTGWHPDDELIVIDNCSTDGTREYLQELMRVNSCARVLLNDENRGFASANNQGLAHATGDVLILLNNDTLTPQGWSDGLTRWLEDASIGMVGPVTNRTCNEAQIDAPYRTYGELEAFAREYTSKHTKESGDLSMLAMFCMAMRRDVLERVGALDEQFEIGMFEDDDYARRVRQAGLRIVCAEDVFVHHFGQGSLGELCVRGDYDRILESNRRRFEQKWGPWEPHGRRITAQYRQLRECIQDAVHAHLPEGANIIIVSKGDEELLKLKGRSGWHFPQANDGRYANIYPSRSEEAIAHLEMLRERGGGFLLFPKPSFWWLDHYVEFKNHLEREYRLTLHDADTCLIFDLAKSACDSQ